jgi:putative phosphoribosyl transferase
MSARVHPKRSQRVAARASVPPVASGRAAKPRRRGAAFSNFAFFEDRAHAGKLLAERLQDYAGRKDAVVVGLPRGGVPVAAAVARRLRLPCGFLAVHRLCLRGAGGETFGALAGDGVRWLDRNKIRRLGLTPAAITAATREATRRNERQRRRLAGARFFDTAPAGTLIVVDDGAATGATRLAALAALRRRDSVRLVVAAPTISPLAWRRLEGRAGAVIAVLVPEKFEGVGRWFAKFGPVTTEEMRTVLKLRAARRRPAG